jgi:hypothetical protein
VDLVIAATMEGLSAVSTRLECKSMASLFDRLANVEIAAVMAGIDLLTVRGDKKAALAALKLGHFPAVAGAFAQALSHHFGDDEGNAEAAEEMKP